MTTAPPLDQSTPKSTPRKFEFISGTPNSRWLFKLNRDIDIGQCSPPHSFHHNDDLSSLSICLSPPSPIHMPPSPTWSTVNGRGYLPDQSTEANAFETDSLWWKESSSALLSFLANEQLCSTMLEDEEEPPSTAGVEVIEQSMEWGKDVETHMEGSSVSQMMEDCSMKEMLASVSQAQFNDTIEAMDFYIEKGIRYRTRNEGK